MTKKKKSIAPSVPRFGSCNLKKYTVRRWVDDNGGEGVDFPVLLRPNQERKYTARNLATKHFEGVAEKENIGKSAEDIALTLTAVGVSPEVIALTGAIILVQCLSSGLNLKGESVVDKALDVANFLNEDEVAVISSGLCTKNFEFFS